MLGTNRATGNAILNITASRYSARTAIRSNGRFRQGEKGLPRIAGQGRDECREDAPLISVQS